jgi:hypothetical protein
MLQVGATQGSPATAHPFNATLEVDATGTGTWVPYNRFVGIDDTASWMTDAPLPVRTSSSGLPQLFDPLQLTQSPPAVYMKADPRATRFGIFQVDNNPTGNSRVIESLWPASRSAPPAPTPPPNGYGGSVADPGGPVEHAPMFAGATYYPATLSINNSTTDIRDTAPTTTYPDNDGLTRWADAIYPGSATTTGASTPYSTTAYRPIMLNRPFRNVGEVGYVFRDLPWKTLDFFTDKSADAGLLDVFCINDGTQVLQGTTVVGMAVPTMAAGSVNLNSTQAADLQTVFAGAILDEINSTTANKTDTGAATDAPVLAANVVNATNPAVNPAATPIQNKAELITRVDPVTGPLATTILPTAASDNQAVKARREVVPRVLSSTSQTRVWNVLIDVVAQSGHYKPNPQNLASDFIVEGEQHYWVHVAIDRFTGQVLDKQIEVVNE